MLLVEEEGKTEKSKENMCKINIYIYIYMCVCMCVSVYISKQDKEKTNGEKAIFGGFRV